MTGTAAPLLRTEGLCKAYRRRTVVDEVEVQVGAAEFVGLLGPNGAGKTTTFRMCMGMVRPDRGRIFFHGQEITELAIYQRARLGLGYLAQEPSVFRRLSVEANVLAVLEIQGVRGPERRSRCAELLEELGLSHLRESL